MRLRSFLASMPLLAILLLGSTSSTCQIALSINEVMASNGTAIADGNGEFDDWIEIYNTSDTPINLAGRYITDDPENQGKWQIPDTDASETTVPANGFLILWADGDVEQGAHHLDFKLSASGETVLLFDLDSTTLISELTFPELEEDLTYGRIRDGSNEFTIFASPSPGSSNNNNLSFLDIPTVDIKGGLYKDPQIITLSSSSAGANIYYTTDGSVPTTASNLYTEPIKINSTFNLRAIAAQSGFGNSAAITEVYIYHKTTLPIITITSDPAYFFSDTAGIYVVGTNGVIDNCTTFPANFNRDWEVPANFTMIESDGTQAFNVDAGIEMSGGCTRNKPQKSFNVKARSKYGESHFKHQIFPGYKQDKFKRFKLRNGGQDSNDLHMRDVVVQSLPEGNIDLDLQRSRAVVVFINGEYWGIYNLRDSFSEHWIDENHDVEDKDSIDYLRVFGSQGVPHHGTENHFEEVFQSITSSDLKITANYEEAAKKIDINEYLNYLILQMYVQNTDWPAFNIRVWRERKEDAKYRYMFFDADFALGYTRRFPEINPKKADVNFDMMDFATSESGTGPNSSEGTLMIRKFLENDFFRNEFIQRFATQINTIYSTTSAQAVAQMRRTEVVKELQSHFDRWNGTSDASDGPIDELFMEKWQGEFDYVMGWFEERPDIMRVHIEDHFNLAGRYTLIIPTDETTTGHVVLNENEYPAPFHYAGTYFDNVPLKIRAIPQAGYRFSHWLETGSTNEVDIIVANNDIIRTPIFEPAQDLVINEIHYNPTEKNDEFIEIYNPEDVSRNIGGFYFSDGLTFKFPQGTEIGAGEYILVTNNPDIYSGNGFQVFAMEDGGISNGGETLALSNPSDAIVDSLTYDDADPWNTDADSGRFSLALLNPELDNALAENWDVQYEQLITPGAPNFTNTTQCGTLSDFYLVSAETGRRLTRRGIVFQNCGAINAKVVADVDGQISSSMIMVRLTGNSNSTDNVFPFESGEFVAKPGIYYLKIKVFNATGDRCAEKTTFFYISNCTDPCGNAGGDEDGDGVCMLDDCDDTNPSVGAKLAPGTPCNDDNLSTTNDQIQDDGCTCAGEVPQGCGTIEGFAISDSAGNLVQSIFQGGSYSSCEFPDSFAIAILVDGEISKTNSAVRLTAFDDVTDLEAPFTTNFLPTKSGRYSIKAKGNGFAGQLCAEETIFFNIINCEDDCPTIDSYYIKDSDGGIIALQDRSVVQICDIPTEDIQFGTLVNGLASSVVTTVREAVFLDDASEGPEYLTSFFQKTVGKYVIKSKVYDESGALCDQNSIIIDIVECAQQIENSGRLARAVTKENGTISLFPNPSSGQFSIEIPETRNGPTNIRIMDAAMTKTVFERTYAAGESRININLSQMTPGLFIAVIGTDGAEQVIRKIVLMNPSR